MTDTPKLQQPFIIGEDAGLPKTTLRIPMPQVQPSKPPAPTPVKK